MWIIASILPMLSPPPAPPPVCSSAGALPWLLTLLSLRRLSAWLAPCAARWPADDGHPPSDSESRALLLFIFSLRHAACGALKCTLRSRYELSTSVGHVHRRDGRVSDTSLHCSHKSTPFQLKNLFPSTALAHKSGKEAPQSIKTINECRLLRPRQRVRALWQA